MGSASISGFRRRSSETDKKLEALQNTAAREQSLNDSLNEQWRLVEAEDLVKQAGKLIIDYVPGNIIRVLWPTLLCGRWA